MSIADNIAGIKKQLGPQVTLVAVSKYSPAHAVHEAYAAGQRDFGENKAKDLAARAAEMPDDIHWHFIGHLQRNKVKFIAPFIHCIHSVDSLHLLQEIDKQASKVPRRINCLLQMHIAREETKFGLSEEEVSALLRSPELADLAHVRIIGLMGMATFTNHKEVVHAEFAQLKSFYDELRSYGGTNDAPENDDNSAFPANVDLHVLSMGMSADYKIALDHGTTMVRIGSAVFS